MSTMGTGKAFAPIAQVKNSPRNLPLYLGGLIRYMRSLENF